MSDPIDELKTYLITSLHASRIEEYKAVYRQQNSGKEPSQYSVNKFIQILIASGNINEDAEKIAKDFKSKFIEGNKLKHILSHASSSLAIAGFLALLVLILLLKKIPSYLIKPAAYYPILLGSIISLLMLLIYIVHTVTKKDK